MVARWARFLLRDLPASGLPDPGRDGRQYLQSGSGAGSHDQFHPLHRIDVGDAGSWFPSSVRGSGGGDGPDLLQPCVVGVLGMGLL